MNKTRPVPWRSCSRRWRETDHTMTILINVSLKTGPRALKAGNVVLWRHLIEETDADGGGSREGFPREGPSERSSEQ